MKQCPSCNRSYEDDSLRFCLEDGAALTEPYDSAATLIVRPGRRTDARTEVLPPSVATADLPGRSRTPWTHYVIIALLALIAGGGVVWLLRSGNDSNSNPNAGNGGSPTDQRPPSASPAAAPGKGNSSVPPSTPTPGIPSPPPSRGTWFVILGSFPKAQQRGAEQKVKAARTAGYDASIIDTDNYSGLSPGYWAVVVGPLSESEARRIKGQMAVDFPDAYVKAGW